MAFVLRRPLALSAALKPAIKPTPSRLFHQSIARPIRPKSSPLTASRDAFRRSYVQPTTTIPTTGNGRQRLLYGAGIFGGTILAINLIFNRETREDGGMPLFERAYLNETFLHTGLGVGIIGVAARILHTSGWSVRLMSANPWLVIGGGLVASIGSMYGCMATSPDK